MLQRFIFEVTLDRIVGKRKNAMDAMSSPHSEENKKCQAGVARSGIILFLHVCLNRS